MNYIIVLALYILTYQSLFSQVNGEANLADRDRNVVYLHATQNLEDDDLFGYKKLSFRMGIPPIKINKLTIVNVIGIDYHEFSYSSDAPKFTREFDLFYNVNYTLFTSYKLSRRWTGNAIVSAFTVTPSETSFKFNDASLNGSLFVERTFHNKRSYGSYKVSVGIGYQTLFGKTTIVPMVNLIGDVSKKLSFALGLPNTYVKYDINKNHSFKLFAEINDFESDTNSNLFVGSNYKRIKKIVFGSVLAGFEYDYWLSSSLALMLKASYSVKEVYELQDSDENVLFDFNPKSKTYINIGIKFNPFH